MTHLTLHARTTSSRRQAGPGLGQSGAGPLRRSDQQVTLANTVVSFNMLAFCRRASTALQAWIGRLSVTATGCISPTSAASAGCAKYRIVAHSRPLSGCKATFAGLKVAVLQNAALH